MLLWFKGMLIGLAIAAPMGPTGLLCIQRTLTRGRWSGILSGLGAASADALYGGIAGFGLASLSGLLLAWRVELQVFGGLFLLCLGWQTWQASPVAKQFRVRPTRAGLMGDYFSTLALTATNPVTILAFVGIFTGLGLAAVGQDFIAAGVLVFGVFAGSLLWWLLLAGGIGLMRGRLSPQVLRWINHVSGLLIGGCGVWALLAALLAMLQI
ncbi:MAG: LysE family transporter [Candidatus Competibacteraceae bacterium]|nr:LysE family transporter [Candidatus Competibacteraceae bacterium]MCP5124463.1 LysE family transporter [Gammaproteobacteria bacterium]HRX71567.1 LysE family transporter [Candidatus Competibacteraceae bacterium]HRY15911.1 LysE family transporter [Candidatus Competibacteraceae bacterium]